jgi:hypothetical protein
MEWPEFLACYTGRKRTANEAAIETLGTRALSRKDSFVDTFVKAECVSEAKDGPPRMIQPRSRRFNCYIGRWIKPIEKAVYAALNTMFGGVVVAKGLNAEQRGQALRDHWESLADPVAIILDVSRFDQHVSEPALRWEHSVYQWFVPRDKDFAEKLEWIRDNKGYARTKDGLVKYRLMGKRMSGDMATALGNVLLMIAVLVSFLWSLTVPEKTWRIFDDGDDCALLVERHLQKSVVAQLPRYYKRMGFKLKIEQVTDVFERIRFCQSSPVYSRGRWVMVRDPARCLEKDLMQVKTFRTEKEWRAKLVAIAGCGLALAGDMPIYHAFYSMLGRYGAEKATNLENSRDYMALGMEAKHHEPSIEARVSFFRAFGISPDEQVVLEDYYSSIHPVWCKPAPLELVERDKIIDIVSK